MSAVNQYNRMRANPRVNTLELHQFRAKHGLFAVGDPVVYTHNHGLKAVLVVEQASKRFKATRLRRGRWGNIRVSGELRHAEPHEIAADAERCERRNGK